MALELVKVGTLVREQEVRRVGRRVTVKMHRAYKVSDLIKKTGKSKTKVIEDIENRIVDLDDLVSVLEYLELI